MASNLVGLNAWRVVLQAVAQPVVAVDERSLVTVRPPATRLDPQRARIEALLAEIAAHAQRDAARRERVRERAVGPRWHAIQALARARHRRYLKLTALELAVGVTRQRQVAAA